MGVRMLQQETRDELIRRLRRIEGQTQGIQRMLQEDRDCREVLDQLASVRAATRMVSIELMKSYLATCLGSPDCASSESVDDMIGVLLRV
jgi:DNA-binding FrmR family transcriptional regulator